MGHLFCLYRGEQSYAFPIQLMQAALVKMPSGPAWQMIQSATGQQWQCVNAQRHQCSFELLAPEEANLNSPEKVRAFLRSLKG